MDKYSKTKLSFNRKIKYFMIVIAIILLISISYSLFVIFSNNIVYEKIDNSADHISTDIAKNSIPIILSNVIVGGVYENRWVSAAMYYNHSTVREDTSLEIYTPDGKAGLFTLKELYQNGTSFVGLTDYVDKVTEYYTLPEDTYMSNPYSGVIELTEDELIIYEEYVRNALGIYGILDSSVNIISVYETSITADERMRFLTVISKDNDSGVYSAIISVDSIGNSKLVKYNYVYDLNNSDKFKIYSLKFVTDLNNDDKAEIIISGTDEFETTYSVLEYNNTEFIEVLSETFNNN